MGMYLVGVSKQAGAVNAAAGLPRKLPETRLRCAPMFVRIPFASLSRWGRASLLLALSGLPLYVSCTTSEDTEPFVPAVEGAKQPAGEGALLPEADACASLLKSAKAAYVRLQCDVPKYPACPAFIRPAGGSGCYEYYASSVSACQKQYDDAVSCRALSPCLVTAERNDKLATCELLNMAAGGAGGSSAVGSGGAAQGGAHPEAGGPGAAGAAGVAGAG
jgi:hypothetical protein